MSELSITNGEQDSKKATAKLPMEGFHFDPMSEEEENDRAQRFLRELYAKREKLLAASGVTQDNFAKKALDALDFSKDMELAKAIMGKYVLSPEQEIRVHPPTRFFVFKGERTEPE